MEHEVYWSNLQKVSVIPRPFQLIETIETEGENEHFSLEQTKFFCRQRRKARKIADLF